MVDESYGKMEEGHAQKIEQAISLLSEVLRGEKQEVEQSEQYPANKPSLRDEIGNALKPKM